MVVPEAGRYTLESVATLLKCDHYQNVSIIILNIISLSKILKIKFCIDSCKNEILFFYEEKRRIFFVKIKTRYSVI